MDGAQACYLYFTVRVENEALTSRQAWRSSDEAFAVMLGRTASSADLGGSSKYSNGIFED